MQCLIDEEIESMKVWKGELCLDVHLNGAVNIKRVNVLEYIGLKDSLQSLRFCSKTFPVDPRFANIGWSKLKRYIERSAHASGYNLICNGNFGRNKETRQFVCQYARVHRCNKEASNESFSIGYREDIEMNGSKRCRRKDGKSLPRRRLAVLPTSRDVKCPFRLVVFADEASFGVDVRYGNPCHYGHLNMKNQGSFKPSRLLTEKERKTLIQSFDEDVSCATSHNTLFNKASIFLTRAQVSYIRGIELRKIGDEVKSSSEKLLIILLNKVIILYI